MNNSFDNADEVDDPEWPDRSEMDMDDYTVMSRCLHCKKMIAEDSEICPYCGFLVVSDDAAQKYPLWILVGLALAILGILSTWILRL